MGQPLVEPLVQPLRQQAAEAGQQARHQNQHTRREDYQNTKREVERSKKVKTCLYTLHHHSAAFDALNPYLAHHSRLIRLSTKCNKAWTTMWVIRFWKRRSSLLVRCKETYGHSCQGLGSEAGGRVGRIVYVQAPRVGKGARVFRGAG